jgi:hypothetical protein
VTESKIACEAERDAKRLKPAPILPGKKITKYKRRKIDNKAKSWIRRQIQQEKKKQQHRCEEKRLKPTHFMQTRISHSSPQTTRLWTCTTKKRARYGQKYLQEKKDKNDFAVNWNSTIYGRAQIRINKQLNR